MPSLLAKDSAESRTVMAKAKPGGGDAEGHGGAGGQRKTVLAMKGTPEWAEWLGEFADYCGLPAANLIDSLLVEHARRVGFPKPMPKRQSR